MLDETNHQVIVLASADYRDAGIVGKNDRHTRGRVLGAAIGGNRHDLSGFILFIGIRCRCCLGGIVTCLREEVVDLAHNPGVVIVPFDDHGVIDGDLFGEDFLTWPDTAILRQNVLQVGACDDLAHASKGRQLVKPCQFCRCRGVETCHLAAQLNGVAGHVGDQGRCVRAGRRPRDRFHANHETFVVTAQQKLDIAEDLGHPAAVILQTGKCLLVLENPVIGLDRQLHLCQTQQKFRFGVNLGNLDRRVIDDRKRILLKQRVNDGNRTCLHRHGDGGIKIDHAFRHGGLQAYRSEQEVQRLRKRHVPHGKGDFRIFQHLFQQRRLRTDGAIFAANKDQIIRDLEVIVASAGQIASKDGKGGGANAADRVAKRVLDLDIKVTKRRQNVVLEIKTSGHQNAGTLKAALVGDGKLLGLAQITVGGIDNAVRFIRINRVITEQLCKCGQKILVLEAVRRVPDLDQFSPRQHLEAFRSFRFVNTLDRRDHTFFQHFLAGVHRQIRRKSLGGATAKEHGAGKADRARGTR